MGYPQSFVTGEESLVACLTVVIGPFKSHFSEGGFEGLRASSGVGGLFSTHAGDRRAFMIGGVGVESGLEGTCGHGKGLASCCSFDRLEVQFVECGSSDQRFDLLENFGLEGFFEAPFLAVAFASAFCRSNFASHNWTLVSTSLSQSRRNR